MKIIFSSIAWLLIFFALTIAITCNARAASSSFGLDETANTAFNNTGIPHDSNVDLVLTVGKLVNVVLSFLGIIFLIIIIYGGFLWMTAGGAEEKVKAAIAIFTNASLGLIIVIAAYLITRYIGTAIINSLK